MTAHAEFLADERLDDVLVYLDDALRGTPEAPADVGEPVADGVILGVPGEPGREALQSAVGVDPMTFARDAGDTEGAVTRDCTDASCPAADAGTGHELQFCFAFGEAQTSAAGGLYAEGDVIHAYAQCGCGTRYSDRWVVAD